MARRTRVVGALPGGEGGCSGARKNVKKGV